jgi:hypothetical protein
MKVNQRQKLPNVVPKYQKQWLVVMTDYFGKLKSAAKNSTLFIHT